MSELFRGPFDPKLRLADTLSVTNWLDVSTNMGSRHVVRTILEFWNSSYAIFGFNFCQDAIKYSSSMYISNWSLPPHHSLNRIPLNILAQLDFRVWSSIQIRLVGSDRFSGSDGFQKFLHFAIVVKNWVRKSVRFIFSFERFWATETMII